MRSAELPVTSVDVQRFGYSAPLVLDVLEDVYLRILREERSGEEGQDEERVDQLHRRHRVHKARWFGTSL